MSKDLISKLDSIIKIDLEKHLLSSISSIFISLLAVVIVNEGNAVIVKLGKFWFAVLIACGVFLVLETVKNVLVKAKRKRADKKYNQKIDSEKELKEYNKICTWFDGLPVHHRKLVMRFFDSKNEPVIMNPWEYSRYDGNLNGYYCDSWLISTPADEESDDVVYINNGPRKIKLDDILYKELVYFNEKYGGFSRFQ